MPIRWGGERLRKLACSLWHTVGVLCPGDDRRSARRRTLLEDGAPFGELRDECVALQMQRKDLAVVSSGMIRSGWAIDLTLSLRG